MMKCNSELITWSDTFSCGVTVIDDQHKGLIKLINNFILRANGNQEMERHYFFMTINEVIEYFKIHLATEDKILNATKYPGYDRHKRAHKTFLTTIHDIIDDYKTGKRHNLSIISKYFRNWALTHIAIMDKVYFDYVKKFGLQKPNSELIIKQSALAPLPEIK